jgi:hypothetical protein
MSIRKNRRYAVQHGAQLGHAGVQSAGGAPALLFELWLEGCRLSTGGTGLYASGDRVRVEIDGFDPIGAQVRSAAGDCVGLKFDRPLRLAALGHIVSTCRTVAAETRAFGS